MELRLHHGHTGQKERFEYSLKKNSPVNLAIYRSLETETKRVIYQAKTQNWKEFCDSIKTNGLNSRDFWNKIHRLQGHQICPFPLLKQNDKIARNPRETAQFLIKHYASVSATHNLPKETIAHQGQFERSHSNILNEPGDDLDSMNVEFTLSELKLAIGSRKKSAVGPDRCPI